MMLAHALALGAGGRVRDPLSSFRATLQNAANEPCNIVCLGDSVTEGQGATVYGNRWVNKLRDTLRTRHPSGQAGGIGFVSPTTAMTYTWPVVRTGTNSFQDNYGPKRRAARMVDATTYTLTCTGTAVDLMWLRATAAASFRYRVDGGSYTTVNTQGTTLDGRTTRVNLGASGPHTVDVEWVASTVFFDGFIVYDGDESVGVRVHEAAVSGRSAFQWNTSTLANSWPYAVAALDPDLLVMTLGFNDMGQSKTPAEFRTAAEGMIASMRAAGVTAPVLLQPLYTPNFTGSGGTWAEFIAAMYAMKASDPTLGIFDQSLLMPPVLGDSGGRYSDTTHPTDVGHAEIAANLANYLAPAA